MDGRGALWFGPSDGDGDAFDLERRATFSEARRNTATAAFARLMAEAPPASTVDCSKLYGGVRRHDFGRMPEGLYQWRACVGNVFRVNMPPPEPAEGLEEPFKSAAESLLEGGK